MRARNGERLPLLLGLHRRRRRGERPPGEGDAQLLELVIGLRGSRERVGEGRDGTGADHRHTLEEDVRRRRGKLHGLHGGRHVCQGVEHGEELNDGRRQGEEEEGRKRKGRFVDNAKPGRAVCFVRSRPRCPLGTCTRRDVNRDLLFVYLFMR